MPSMPTIKQQFYSYNLLRKIASGNTQIGMLQSSQSPSNIYNCLRQLEQLGYIKVTKMTGHSGQPLRFQITKTGQDILPIWQSKLSAQCSGKLDSLLDEYLWLRQVKSRIVQH